MTRARKAEGADTETKTDLLTVDDDEKVTSPLTPAQRVRLECVQLAYRHDRSPQDITVRADGLAAFVMDGKPAPGTSGNGGQAGPETSPT